MSRKRRGLRKIKETLTRRGRKMMSTKFETMTEEERGVDLESEEVEVAINFIDMRSLQEIEVEIAVLTERTEVIINPIIDDECTDSNNYFE
jgi:hypothetical protein